MFGFGKSEKRVAEKLNYTFLDLDYVIEKNNNSAQKTQQNDCPIFKDANSFENLV